jgi:hypothetical protein
MAISDAAKGRMVTSVPIGAGVDGAGYDPVSRNAFASNGEGTLTVVHQRSADAYEVAQTVATMTGARTVAVDPTTHVVYTVGARYGAPPAQATKENPRRRAPIEPGSATLLVIGH